MKLINCIFLALVENNFSTYSKTCTYVQLFQGKLYMYDNK